MRVSFATEPAPDAENLDHVLALPGLVCVFDGVTAPPELGTGCVHGTAWYVRQLAARLAVAHASTPAEALTSLVSTAIEATRAAHEGLCDLNHPGTPSSTLCLLRENDDHADWLVLADSPLVLDRCGTIEVLVDDRVERLSTTEGDALVTVSEMAGSEEYRDVLLAFIESQRPFRNQPGGYWVAAATPEAARHALTGSTPPTGPGSLSRAVLLTDGASRAVDTHRLYDWAGLVLRAAENGPAAVITDVRDAEYANRRRRQQWRLKAHDDATAALVTF